MHIKNIQGNNCACAEHVQYPIVTDRRTQSRCVSELGVISGYQDVVWGKSEIPVLLLLKDVFLHIQGFDTAVFHVAFCLGEENQGKKACIKRVLLGSSMTD